MLKYFIISLRPGQWIKNTVIFAGVIFAQKFTELSYLFQSIKAFLIFCLLSGSVYLINDALDKKNDQIHPLKAQRPIASGKLKVTTGVMLAFVLIFLSLIASFLLSRDFAWVAVTYLILNLAYSTYLKHLVIIDVMSVALGFVLRAVAGAVVIEVEISPWLLVCTILLALFLALGRRRYELLLLEENAISHRKTLSKYSAYVLDQMIAVVTASTVIAYAFYTLSPEIIKKLQTHYLSLTLPFVLYGIFRYLYLIHQHSQGGSPTRTLLTDRPLLLNILLWLVAVIIILY